MPIILSNPNEVNGPRSRADVRIIVDHPETLQEFARRRVAEYRQRQGALSVLARPVEAARCAVLSHLAHISVTTGVVDADAATRIAVAAIEAYLTEPLDSIERPTPLTEATRGGFRG